MYGRPSRRARRLSTTKVGLETRIIELSPKSKRNKPMRETPTDRETVERIIAKQPMLTSLPPQENDVAKTLRALVAERDALAARIEELEAKLVKVEEDVAKWQHAF